MSETRQILKQNLDSVEERITAACARAGRKRSEVTLVAVTKYVDVDVARMLLELGVTDLGESRPQELWRKAAALPKARWHLVGHLQRNKVEQTFPTVVMIHSVDSMRLWKALEVEADGHCFMPTLLVEFNLSGDESKHGFRTSEMEVVLSFLQDPLYAPVEGLMTMGPLESTLERTRAAFAELRDLRDRLVRANRLDHPLTHLSMGMTNDFEIAIEEGATLVRIGSALFEGLETRAT